MIERHDPTETPARRLSRHGRTPFGAILAIHPDGRIAKANLQARRLFGKDHRLEGERLGATLGRIMAEKGLTSQRLQLRILDEEGLERDVTLVLSEEERSSSAKAPSHPSESGLDAVPVELPAPSNAIDFIAHELRNNLAITLGLSQILESNHERLTRDERLSAIRGIQLEAHHALQVLEGVLRLAETRQRGEQAQVAVPVHAVLQRVVSDHARRCPDRKIVVTGDGQTWAIGQSMWMQIAIGNLLSNAEKVTPEGKPIHLDVRQAGEHIHVLVIDEGRALTAPAYQGLWEIYDKGPPNGVDLSGSGIGLSLCKKLVTAMGGRVWAGPRREGGSVFAISLRRVTDGSEASGEAA